MLGKVKGILKNFQLKKEKGKKKVSERKEDLQTDKQPTPKGITVSEFHKTLFEKLSLAKTEEELLSLFARWNRTSLDLVEFIKTQTDLGDEEIAKAIAEVSGKEFEPTIREEVVSVDRKGIIAVGKSGKTYSYININADVIVPKGEFVKLVKERERGEYGTETEIYFKELLERALKQFGNNLSDLKLSPEFQVMHIYAIVVGEKEQLRIDTVDKGFGDKLVNYLMVISGADPTVKDKPQSAKLVMEDFGIEARLEFIPSEKKGVACVIRIFPIGTYFNKRLEDLNLDEKEIVILRKHARSRKGLILVNGETSSGKSTTIRAMIMEANPERSNVWAVEHPVEVVMRGVHHIQVKENVVSFADAIRSFMRVNPKIIFVGEVRDSETAKAVLDAVSTGHMVFTTLHTKDNPSAILRFASLLQDEIENMEFVYSLIADTLALAINQRLVITKDGRIKPILSIFEPKLEDRKLLAENRIIELRQRLFERGELVARKVYSLVKNGLIEPEKYISTLSIEERMEFVEWLKAVINGDIPFNGKKASEKTKDKLKKVLEDVLKWEEEYA